MNSLQPDALSVGALAADLPLVRAPTDNAAAVFHVGRPYAVPFADVVGKSGPVAEALYRAFEITFTAAALIVALPVMLIEAALVRWDSPGPALFFHRRVAQSAVVPGRDVDRHQLRTADGSFEPDRLYYVPSYLRFVKFRTMYQDSRSRFPELFQYDFASPEYQARPHKRNGDPRVTKIGRILRKLTLDELPNLWCVLNGSMRLVGPRPEHPDIVQYYSPEQMYKFACKPGITGLAQIKGRSLLSFSETLAWDLEYVRTRSVWLDLKILFLTLPCLISRRGAF